MVAVDVNDVFVFAVSQDNSRHRNCPSYPEAKEEQGDDDDNDLDEDDDLTPTPSPTGFGDYQGKRECLLGKMYISQCNHRNVNDNLSLYRKQPNTSQNPPYFIQTGCFSTNEFPRNRAKSCFIKTSDIDPEELTENNAKVAKQEKRVFSQILKNHTKKTIKSPSIILK